MAKVKEIIAFRHKDGGEFGYLEIEKRKLTEAMNQIIIQWGYEQCEPDIEMRKQIEYFAKLMDKAKKYSKS